MTKTRNFYKFDQNNSGGIFDCDDKVCAMVIIEAENFEEAKEKAERYEITDSH